MFDFAFSLIFLIKYYLVDEIKEEEMHRACGTYGGVGGHDESLLQCSVGETWWKETYCKGRCAWEGMDKIDVAQDSGMCREWTFCFHELYGISSLAENPLASQ